MKVYSIFDDFGEEPVKILQDAGIEIEVHPLGMPRPDSNQMKRILEKYDGVIIGTTQKITEDMFDKIISPRVIGTASVGLDHIHIPEEKKSLVTVFNTPKANAQSVAEYTMGCALTCCKRLLEGRTLYLQGKNNKTLVQKPEDLRGKILGVVGGGNISFRIMEYGKLLGMKVLCWTAHPESHKEISDMGVSFVELDKLLREADVISVNLPNNSETQNIICNSKVSLMKDDAVFISVSRADTVDYEALLRKARENPGFYVCLDVDVDEDIVKVIPAISNVIVTPHIAGGTAGTRKRMFKEVAFQIAEWQS